MLIVILCIDNIDIKGKNLNLKTLKKHLENWADWSANDSNGYSSSTTIARLMRQKDAAFIRSTVVNHDVIPARVHRIERALVALPDDLRKHIKMVLSLLVQ